MKKLKGIIPPMITPLTEDETLDRTGLEKLVEHLIEGGVHGLFVLGTTGEGPSLEYALRKELIQAVCDQAEGRVPVLVGITDTSFKEAIGIAEEAKGSGAEAVVMAPPFYFQISQAELYSYTNRILDEIPLPVFLYNLPPLTKTKFGREILKDLLSRPEVIGFKDSSGDLIYFQKLKKLTDSFGLPLLIGPEELLIEALVIGGAGGVPGGANIFPSLYVNLFNVVKDNNLSKGLNLNEKIIQLSEIVYGDVYGSSSIISGIKTALFHMGICNSYVSKPLSAISEAKADQIKEFISTEQVK